MWISALQTHFSMTLKLLIKNKGFSNMGLIQRWNQPFLVKFNKNIPVFIFYYFKIHL